MVVQTPAQIHNVQSVCMIFKTRNIPKQVSTVYNFGIKKLIVSGCSYTYNQLENVADTWPYYLRDLGGFEQVLDSSLPGAGNSHISNSLIWGLEIDRPDPATSLVIVMWSGHDRDDYIVPKDYINEHSYQFYYTQSVMSAINKAADNHSVQEELKTFALAKNNESRAVESYLNMVKTYQYLKSLNYRFLFLNFIDTKNPVGGTNSFEIRKYLPKSAQQKYNSMITDIMDPYHFSVRYNLLSDDNFHPNEYGQLRWTRSVLMPYLQTVIV